MTTPADSGLDRIVLNRLLDEFYAPAPEDFRPFRPGVDILALYGMDDPEATGPSAAFLRYAPGASVPTHLHTGYEHIFVLQGSQQDAHGVYTRGTCIISPPGSRHAVASTDGCLVLAVWSRPVQMLED